MEVMLLSAIVFLIVGALMVGSIGNYDSAKTGVDIKLVERDLSKLAGVVHDVSFGSNSVQTADLNLRTADSQGTTSVDDDAGQISVVVSNSSGSQTVYSGPLGRVEYSNDRTHLAYQGSGVWRKGVNGASIVDSASFSLKNTSEETLSLPILVINGDDRITSKATVRRTSDPQYSKFKLSPEDQATITIQSRYYQAWGRYFTDDLDVDEGNITIDESTQTVTVTFGAGEQAYLHVGIYPVTVSEN